MVSIYQSVISSKSRSLQPLSAVVKVVNEHCRILGDHGRKDAESCVADIVPTVNMNIGKVLP